MSRRRGVSLVELLIALTVLGVIAGAATKLLISESRTSEVKEAARTARSVSRAAINLLESELRMAESGGLTTPINDSTITIFAPYAFGVVCIAGAGGTAMAMLPAIEDPPSGGATGHAGWAWRDATGGYIYEPSTSVASDSPSSCTSVGISPVSGGRVVGLPAPSGSPASGTIGFLYRQLTYQIKPSGIYPGRRGLFRTAGANGVEEEIAAPFSTGSRFRWYILDDPLPQDTLPTDLVDVRGIQFVLNGESPNSPRTAGSPIQAPFSTSIFFQNRPN